MLSTPVATPPASPPHSPRPLLRAQAAEAFAVALAGSRDRCSSDASEGSGNHSEAAMVARERRLAVVGAAEAQVRIREAAGTAMVERMRHHEDQLTERCRVEATEQTRRVELLASVAETALTEKHRTQRQRDLLAAATAREVLAAKVEERRMRARTRNSMLTVFEWTVASLVGAVGATATSGTAAVGAAAVSGSQKRVQRAGGSQYVAALIIVAFVRHLWLHAGSRRALLWSMEHGPFVKGVLLKTVQVAMGMLKDLLAGGLDGGRMDPSAKGPPTGNGLPLLGPDGEPGWVSHQGRDGRVFWHHLSQGPPPWELAAAINDAHSGGAPPPTDSATPCRAPRPPVNSGASPPRSDAPPPHATSSSPYPQAGSPQPPAQNMRLGALLANWGLGRYADALEPKMATA